MKLEKYYTLASFFLLVVAFVLLRFGLVYCGNLWFCFFKVYRLG